MTNNQLYISDALSNGWNLWKKHCLLFAVAFFGISTITYFLKVGIELPFSLTQLNNDLIFQNKTHTIYDLNYWESYFKSGQWVGKFVASSISSIIIYPFITGLENCILNINKGIDHEFSLKGYKMPIATYLKCFVIDFIVGTICMVGYLFFIIPGIYLNARLIFAKTCQLDNKETDITECIKRSWEMTNGNVLTIIGLKILYFGIKILGVMACCIGLYFALPLTQFIHNDAYFQLKGNIQTNTIEYQQ